MPSVPFLSAHWLDQKMQAEAQACGLWREGTSGEETALDINAFLTRYLGVDLDLDASLGDDVLGEVVFRRGKKTCVNIGAELSREAEKANCERGAKALAARGRFRLTLAHEAAHVLLHGPLFERQDDGATIHRCYKRENKTFSENDFEREHAEFTEFYGELARVLVRQKVERARMEWQANRGAAALLMPTLRFRAAALELGQLALQNAPNFAPAQHREWVLFQLAARFGVSVQAATIRAQNLRA